MTSLRDAAQQALEAWDQPHGINYVDFRPYMDALRAALAEPVRPTMTPKELADSIKRGEKWKVAEPVQEPVAWRTFDGEGGYDYRSYENNEDYIYQYIKRNGGKYASWVEPLYTAPPQRKPLTEEEIGKVAAPYYGTMGFRVEAFARAIERAHGIGEQA